MVLDLQRPIQPAEQCSRRHLRSELAVGRGGHQPGLLRLHRNAQSNQCVGSKRLPGLRCLLQCLQRKPGLFFQRRPNPEQRRELPAAQRHLRRPTPRSQRIGRAAERQPAGRLGRSRQHGLSGGQILRRSRGRLPCHGSWPAEFLAQWRSLGHFLQYGELLHQFGAGPFLDCHDFQLERTAGRRRESHQRQSHFGG